MQFAISYSGGKDSVLALHHMLAAGHTPVGLLVTVNRALQRSWFHGVELPLLEQISASLDIPLIPCVCGPDDYNEALEQGMRQARAMGAQACVFGDIDLEDHLAWCQQRCDAVGLERIHPLWHRDRERNTREVISLGYQAIIKCVRNQDLPQSFLGRMLDEALLQEMLRRGVDVCGETGEYHTLVVGGPLFHRPVRWQCREILDFGDHSAINICAG